MPCYKPLRGYRARTVNETGKRSIVFNPKEGYQDLEIKVPCGRCIGCRLEYSRQWAVRCVHEADMHQHNAFITLTYRPEDEPADKSVHKDALQKFFKRLRKAVDEPIRYFACGEYGEQRNRPHYHAIIFGYDFPDRYLWSVQNGYQLYRSPLLEKVWPFGYSTIGEVTLESAAYVARYVMKKHKPDKRKSDEENAEPYRLVDPETGEMFHVEPEFCLMSRRPGIGKTWLETYRGDAAKDFVTINGKVHSLPKYYDSLLEQWDSADMERRKNKRMEMARRKGAEEYMLERLSVKEIVKQAACEFLPRNLEKCQ